MTDVPGIDSEQAGVNNSVFKTTGGAMLAYLLAAIVVTWPVSAHLTEATAGFTGRDSFQHIWLLWWFKQALLEQGRLPSAVNMLYFPMGASHPILWLHPLVTFMGLPFTLLPGADGAYNILFILSFVLSGLSGYLFCSGMCKNRIAGWIGGLVFAFAPNRLGHALAGHLLLISTFTLPLYALALWLLMKKPSRSIKSLFTVTLFLTLMSHPNFIGYFLLPVTIVGLAYAALTRRAHLRRFSVDLLLCGCIALLAFLPFVLPTLSAMGESNLAYLQAQETGEHSADLMSFFLPSPFQPLWGDQFAALSGRFITGSRDLEEGFNYLGIAVIALAMLGVRRHWRKAWPWLSLVLLAGLFSLGPMLKILGTTTSLTLPYSWLVDLPFFAWSRTPGRLNTTTMLAAGCLAALGSASMLSAVRRHGRRLLLAGALSLFILVDYLPLFPFPVDIRPVPVYYRELGSEHSPGGLVDMPIDGSRRASNYAMYYQTIHQRPLVGGYIERDPAGTAELRAFVDRLLSPSLYEEALMPSPGPAERLAVLKQLNVTDVVAHPSLMTDRSARQTLDYLPSILGPADYQAKDLLAWRVPTGAETLPKPALFLAEEGWQPTQKGKGARLEQEGLLFIFSPEAGKRELSLELTSGVPGKTIAVGRAATITTMEGMAVVQPEINLNQGFNYFTIRFTDCPECTADFWHISLK